MKAAALLPFDVPHGYLRNQPQDRVLENVPLGGVPAANPTLLHVLGLHVPIIVAIPGNKARGAVSTADLQGAFFVRWPCEWQIGLRFYASSSRQDSGSRLASGTNIADWSGEQPREDSAEFLHCGARKGDGYG